MLRDSNPFHNIPGIKKLQLKPGAVFSVNDYEFEDGTKHPCKLIVLVSDSRNDNILFLLTTSKVDKRISYMQGTHDYVILDHKVSKFELETLVIAQQVNMFNVDTIEEEGCRFLFMLDEDVKKIIFSKVINHPNTKPIHKKRIQESI